MSDEARAAVFFGCKVDAIQVVHSERCAERPGCVTLAALLSSVRAEETERCAARADRYAVYFRAEAKNTTTHTAMRELAQIRAETAEALAAALRSGAGGGH